MLDLTVIVPILELDEKGFETFEKALDSAKDCNVVVVGSSKALETVKSSKHTFTATVNEGDTSFSAQVNAALKSIKTKYFSVLEYDDVYTDIWFVNVEKYINASEGDVFAYFPLVELIDSKDETLTPIGYVNEALWASSFSEELGYFDLTALENYMDYNSTGAVFKTDEFVSLGGLKASMKLTFWYEFLLRAVYYKKKMFVIPKVGYLHFINRDGSLSHTYAETMTSKEADWWVDTAKKEYFFQQDRNKTYEE